MMTTRTEIRRTLGETATDAMVEQAFALLTGLPLPGRFAFEGDELVGHELVVVVEAGGIDLLAVGYYWSDGAGEWQAGYRRDLTSLNTFSALAKAAQAR